MKKTMFLAIMAGAALAGCVKNEPVAETDGSPELITFEAPVVSIPTKATEIVNDYPKDKDFAVFALYHPSDFSSFDAADAKVYMNNVKCVANKTGVGETPDYWAPATDYYWPKKGKLTFAAYAPHQATGVSWGSTGFTFTDFTVVDEPASQYDLLYSGRVYNQTETSMATNNPYDGVTISFNHALSSIVFTAKTEAEYTGHTFTIKKITVNNVVNKGTFTQNLKADQGGFIDGKTGPEWTVTPILTGTDKNVVDYAVFDGTKQLTADAQYFTADDPSADGFADNVKAAGKRNSDLILIPQQLDEQKDGSNNVTKKAVTVTVVYEHKFKEADNTTETIETVSTVFQLAVGPEASQSYEWVMGKRYTYDITIGLNKIYFNPNVTDWDDKDGIVIE